jgi:hypothetical protein
MPVRRSLRDSGQAGAMKGPRAAHRRHERALGYNTQKQSTDPPSKSEGGAPSAGRTGLEAAKRKADPSAERRGLVMTACTVSGGVADAWVLSWTPALRKDPATAQKICAKGAAYRKEPAGCRRYERRGDRSYKTAGAGATKCCGDLAGIRNRCRRAEKPQPLLGNAKAGLQGGLSTKLSIAWRALGRMGYGSAHGQFAAKT